jgi:O-antigen/teichoic acid export membrane protein
VAREVTRGTGLILAGATVSQAVEYVYRLALARGLGVDGFGTFSQARSVLLLLVVLWGFGLGPGVKRFVALEREAGRGALARRVIRDGTRLAVAAAALGGVILWLLAEPLAAVYRNPALATPLQILAFALPLCVGLEYVTRVGEGVRSFRSTVVARQVLEPCLRVGATVVVVVMGFGLPAVMQAYVVSALAGLVAAIALVGRLETLRDLPRDAAPPSVGPLLRYSLPLVAGAVFFDVAERVDILMLGLYMDEGHVGIYAAGSALARSLLLLFASTMPVVATLAAEAVGRGRPEEIALLRRTTARWMLFFTLPIAAGFFLYAPEAITILFGREYAASATTARILIPAYLVSILAGPLGLFLDAFGKTHWTLANVVGRVLLNVGLNAVLIPRFGVVGAAAATGVALVLAVAVHRINLGSLVRFRGTYAGWGRPLGVLGVAVVLSVGAQRVWAVGGAGGTNADVVAGLVGGVVLVAAFWIGVRVVPGCLGEGDLALLGFFRERLGR